MSFITFDCREYRDPVTKWTPSLTWNVIGAVRLPFHLPHLIMNRHFRGRRHGLELSMLNFEVPIVSRYGPRCTRKWTAKIVDNELMLRSEMTVEYSGPELRLFLDHTEHGICNHERLDRAVDHWTLGIEMSGLRQRRAIEYSRQVKELSRGRHFHSSKGRDPGSLAAAAKIYPGSEPWFTPAGGKLRSCSHCMTDSVINISQRESPAGGGGEEGNWVVTVRTWHDLGSVRSPMDWKWASLAKDNHKPRREIRRSARFGKGAVWRKWVAGKVSSGE